MAKAPVMTQPRPRPRPAPAPPRAPVVPAGRLPGWVYRLRDHRGLFVPVGFVLLLVVLLVPMPPFVPRTA